MKPLNIGLLTVGAVLAGGLAYKMTQPPAIPVIAPEPQPVVSPPPVAAIPFQKPSPMAVVRPKAEPSVPTVKATAPEPVYDEPPKQAIRKNEANSPKAAAPKNEPILQANNKPKEWVPGKYQGSGATTPAAKPEPVVTAALQKPAAPPVVPAVQKQDTPAPAPHQATLQPGMALTIRLNESLSSDYSAPGGAFAASLAEPLVADGFVIAERGARVSGRIVEVQKGGRAAGLSRIELGLTNVTTSDGQEVAIMTEPWINLGDSVASNTVVRFRLTSRVTITERKIQ